MGASDPGPCAGWLELALNLRSTSSDASAAYLASVGGCAPQCQQLDTSFGPPSLSPHVVGALAAYNQTAGGAVSMEMALASRQRTLVAQADMQAWKLQLEAASPVKLCFFLKPSQVAVRSWLRCRLDQSAWNLPCLPRNCATGLGWPKLQVSSRQNLQVEI